MIRGFLQVLGAGCETFSPTLKFVTLRLLLALTSLYGWDLLQMDVCNAFLNASLPEDNLIYMKCVDGYERPGYVIKLLKALYGLKEAPHHWYQHLKKFLIHQLHLKECVLDACLFYLVKGGRVVLLVGIYVDDLLVAGLSHETKSFRESMKREFLMDDLGRPKLFLGLDLKFSSQGLILSCESYINKLKGRFRFEDSKGDRTKFATPMAEGTSCKY